MARLLSIAPIKYLIRVLLAPGYMDDTMTCGTALNFRLNCGLSLKCSSRQTVKVRLATVIL